MQKQNQSLYLIKSNLTDGQLIITLDILDSKDGSKIIKSFGVNYSEDNLPEDIKKNFKDISNVHCILNDSPDTCRVNVEKGVITMVYHIVFPNGHKFQLEGHLLLEQRELPIVQETKADQFNDKRVLKIQENLQKLQDFCQKETQQRQKQIQNLSKEIREEISILKQRYEEMKYWKSQQDIKLKQLQISQKSNSNGNKKLEFSDQLMHIFDQRFDDQKKFFTQRLQKQADKTQDLSESSGMYKKIVDRLSQQNLEMKKRLKVLEQRSEIICEKSQVMEVKLMQQMDKNEHLVKAVSSQHEQIQQIKTEVNSPKKEGRKQPMDPLSVFFQGMNQNQSKPNLNKNTFTNPLFNLSQQTSPKASQDKTINSGTQVMQIHPQSDYSKQFINNGKVIIYNGVTEEPTQLLGRLKIQHQRVCFLAIIKSKRNHIGFGVMDQKYYSDRNSIKKSNFIIFYGYNGGVYQSNGLVKSSEAEVKVGDRIKMKVNPVEGSIQWSISSIVVCKYKSQKLKNNEIGWVPFISLCDRGDTVRWTVD